MTLRPNARRSRELKGARKPAGEPVKQGDAATGPDSRQETPQAVPEKTSDGHPPANISYHTTDDDS